MGAVDDEHPEMSSVSNVIEEINATFADITEARRRVEELRHELNEHVIALASIEDKNERLRIVRHLYWNEELVNTKALAAALLIEWDHVENRPKHGPVDVDKFGRYVHDMRLMVGPIGTIPCTTPGCSGRVSVTSRTALKSLQKSGPQIHYCESCVQCPVRPVPCPDWEKHVALVEEKRAKWLEAYQRRREAGKAELATLKERANLSEEELVRLYKLMSMFDGEME